MPGLTPGYEALSKREQPHHTPYVSRWVLTKLIVLGVAATKSGSVDHRKIKIVKYKYRLFNNTQYQ